MKRSRWFLSATLAAGGILALPISVASGSPARAGEADGPSPTGGPRVEIAQMHLETGTVDPGTKVPFDFVVRNTGSAPLEILNVKPFCGCVVAAFDHVIAPGGTGAIHAVLNTLGRQGTVRKEIDVTTNDPKKPNLVLTVKAFARQVLQVDPGDELALPLVAGKALTQPVTVRSMEGMAFRVLRVESTAPYVRALPLETGTGTARRVRLTVLPTAPDRAFDALVTLKLDHPKIPEVILRVRGFPRRPIMARPERLYFGAVTAQAPVTRDVMLARTEGAFRVLGVETDDPRLRTEIIAEPAGRGCDVIVTCQGGGKPGPLKGVITIRTDDPGCPRIVVPYTAEAS
jgi:Protein of unknown function (DUF1573)